MEESWYITPPPCFVSGPYDTKPSSLENLLIEQPGVNFLNNNFTCKKANLRTEGKDSDQHKLPPKHLSKPIKQKENIMKTVAKEKEPPQHEEKRRQLLEIHEQKKFINSCQSQIHTAQKVAHQWVKFFLYGTVHLLESVFICFAGWTKSTKSVFQT